MRRGGDEVDVGGDRIERFVDQQAWWSVGSKAFGAHPFGDRVAGDRIPVVVGDVDTDDRRPAPVALEKAAADRRRVLLAHAQRDLVVDPLNLARQAGVEPIAQQRVGRTHAGVDELTEGDGGRHGNVEREASPGGGCRVVRAMAANLGGLDTSRRRS